MDVRRRRGEQNTVKQIKYTTSNILNRCFGTTETGEVKEGGAMEDTERRWHKRPRRPSDGRLRSRGPSRPGEGAKEGEGGGERALGGGSKEGEG